jgi:hypothetical protein
LRQSRDLWRKKYGQLRKQAERDRKQPAKEDRQNQQGIKVRHHSYRSLTMMLAIRMRSLGMISLRNCQKLLLLWYCLLDLELKVPCINTIRNWEHKLGYYQLNERGCPQAEYAIIVDESFCIGKQTLLLVLGVNLSTYQWEGALDFNEIQVLALGPKSYWKGDEIAQVLEQLSERKYRIAYVVSDGGNNLVKAFKARQIVRVEDCTHFFSKLIEKRYKNDSTFKAFSKRVSLLNRQCWMSSFACICPPKLRGKARFLNLYPLASWGEKNLKLLEILNRKKRMSETEKQVCEKLKWIREYEKLIEQLNVLTRVMKACFKLLKNQGLSCQNVQRVKRILDKNPLPDFFTQGVLEYLERNSALLKKYDHLFCCSDIIESFFGMFKNQQRLNPSTGITMSCLRMPSYGKSIEEKQLIKIIEQVKVVDLHEWQNANLLKTVSAKKRELYKNCG